MLNLVILQDNLREYGKLLGFLSSEEQEDGHCVDIADALVMSEVNFKRHIAYERRADSSTILEHWVPAYISQLQLEIYCSILVSNSSVLQSQMKSDSSLCDIVMSLSKVCFPNKLQMKSDSSLCDIVMSLSKVCFPNKFTACMITSNQSMCNLHNAPLFVFCEVTDIVIESDIFLSLCYSAVITLTLLMSSCQIRLPTIMIVLIL